MSYHKDAATEIIAKWDVKQIDDYITHLKVRHAEEGEWIRYVQTIRRKKMSKSTPENGPRDGR